MSHIEDAKTALQTAQKSRPKFDAGSEDEYSFGCLEAAVSAVVAIAEALTEAIAKAPIRHDHETLGLTMVYQQYGLGQMSEDEARERINVIKGGFAEPLKIKRDNEG